MSEQVTFQDLEQYVDWDGLKYYDSRIKTYIEQQGAILVGGDKHPYWLEETPISDNLYKLYRITQSFVTGETFQTQGISCGGSSVVYLDKTSEGLKYKILVNVPESANITSEAWATLVKQVENTASNMSGVLESLEALHDEVEDAENRISEVVEDLRSTEHSIHDVLHSHEQRISHLSETTATKAELAALESKISSGGADLTGYATQEFVIKQVDQIQLTITSVSNQLTSLEEEMSSNYPTREDLQNSVREVVEAEVSSIVEEKISEAIGDDGSFDSISYGTF